MIVMSHGASVGFVGFLEKGPTITSESELDHQTMLARGLKHQEWGEQH